jgi:thioredoxin 1
MKKLSSFSVLSVLVLFSILANWSCTRSSEKDAGGDTDVQIAAPADTVAAHLPKLLDLGSDYCKPCKKMAPILDSLKIVYQGKAEIEFIDIKKDKQSARKYGITMIPTQIFFDAEGKEKYRHVGFLSAESITTYFKLLDVEL